MTMGLGVALFGVWIVIGFPWVALATSKRKLDVPLTIAMSPAVGIAIVMMSGVLLSRLGLYRHEMVLVSFVTLVGYMWTAINIRHLASTSIGLLGVFLSTGAVALSFRLKPLVFLFQTGDMGEYTNMAVAMARGHGRGGGFPPGFSSTLAFSFSLGGIEALTSTVVALSLVTLLGVLTAGRLLGVDWKGLVGLGLLVAVQIHFMWFGVFPVSESLFAALVVGVVVLAIRFVRARSHGLAVVAGLVLGSLGLVRGDALLTVVAFCAGAFALAFVSRKLAPLAITFSAVAIFASFVAFGYVIRFNHDYMVVRQLTRFVPSPLFDPLSDTVVFNGSNETLVFWVAMGIAAAGATVGVLRAVSPRGPSPERWRSRVVTTGAMAILVLTSVYALTEAPRTIADVGMRVGLLVVVLTIVSVVVLARHGGRRAPAVILLTLATAIAVPFGVHASRFPESPSHAYYLYWDRYLYAAAIPMMLILLLAALSLLRFAAPKAEAQSRTVSSVGWIFVISVVVAAALSFPQAFSANRYHMFGTAYVALDSVASASTAQQSRATYYSGGDLPGDWFFPNTFRAIGLPLDQTFGVPFENLPNDPFGPDPQLVDVLAAIEVMKDPATVVLVGSCDADCQLMGEGVDTSNGREWQYRYRVPVNAGMERLSDWSEPWLLITVFHVNP